VKSQGALFNFMDWFNIARDAEGTAHVFLRDDIGCGGKTSGDLARELNVLSPKRISLQIDSTGGSANTGANLFAIFSRYQTEVLITGNCFSSAIIAAMAGRTRRILPAAKILIHSPTHYINGTPEELRAAATHLEKLNVSIFQILRERTKQPAPVVARWLAGDTWFSAQAALACGLVDEIMPPVPTARVQAVATGPAVATITEAEKSFQDWLAAFGRIQVSDRARFIYDLNLWAIHNVTAE
jgi:ATP-dependent Clp protease protease subunit